MVSYQQVRSDSLRIYRDDTITEEARLNMCTYTRFRFQCRSVEQTVLLLNKDLNIERTKRSVSIYCFVKITWWLMREEVVDNRFIKDVYEGTQEERV